MLTNSEAIILGYINYSETSIILKAYTKDFGFKSFIIRGIRTKKKEKNNTWATSAFNNS